MSFLDVIVSNKTRIRIHYSEVEKHGQNGTYKRTFWTIKNFYLK